MRADTVRASLAAAAVCLLGIAILSAGQSESLPREFERAVTLIESRGDLAGAAQILEKVAGSPDRSLAARALVYLGACYEGLSADKARQVYRRVVDSYADQADAAAEARTRLSELDRLAAGATGSARHLTLRKLWTTRPAFGDSVGWPSADGRSLLLVDLQSGRMSVQSLPSEQLGSPVDVGSARGSMSACWPDPASHLSPDGTEVAFACEPEPGGRVTRFAACEWIRRGRSGAGCSSRIVAPRSRSSNGDCGIEYSPWSRRKTAPAR